MVFLAVMSATDVLAVVLKVALVLVSALMVMVILMQRSKGEGLGAAMGGGMTSEVFGAGSSALVKITVWCAVLFFGITLTLSALSRKERTGKDLASKLEAAAAEDEREALSTPLAGTNALATNAVEATAVKTSAAPVEVESSEAPAAAADTNAPAATPGAGAPSDVDAPIDADADAPSDADAPIDADAAPAATNGAPSAPTE